MHKFLAKLDIYDKIGLSNFLKQFLRFGIVGVFNTLISLITYYVLIYFGVNYIVANIGGFLMGTTNAYFWNSKVVFKKKHMRSIELFIKTLLAYGSSFLLSTIFLYLMVDLLSISKLIAPMINLVITIPLNFILNKFWTFK